MSQRHDDSELLTRYFLGEVSSTERELVEEKYFSTNDTLNSLLQAEDELIDDYVRGSLNTPERVLFEKNFLCTASRRQRLEFTKSLVDALAESAVDVPALHQAGQGQLFTLRFNAILHAEISQRASLASRQELFDRLLEWLDPIGDKAAEKFEKIRQGLIKIFIARGRGRVHAEELADDTIDHVSSILAQHEEPPAGEPTLFFTLVAENMLMGKGIVQEGAPQSQEEPNEELSECLETCLGQLSETNRNLILQYYSSETENEVGNRESLAQTLGVSLSALRIRAHRIRTSLQKCVESCLARSE